MVHLDNGILPGHKKKELLPFAIACMDLESIMLSEMASQRKTNTIWFHLYVKSNEQNEQKQNRNRLIDTENRLTAVGGVVGQISEKGEGIN